MQAGEHSPCVSVVIPLQDIMPQDKRAAMLTAGKAIEKAGEILQGAHPRHYEKLINSLHDLLEQFDLLYDPLAEGAGFFVSPGFHKLILFPFPVREKIQLADNFLIREVLYMERYAMDYYVLHLNEKAIQCYEGRLNKLEEISDNNFPRELRDDYEYSRPARSTSHAGQAGVKGFEKDRSILEVTRLKTHYREADHLLEKYLGESPLIIAGPKKSISCFQESTHHKKNIVGVINGNYSHTEPELGNRSWAVLKNWIDEHEDVLVGDLLREKWQQRAVDGLKGVWKAVNEGKGYMLLVEKDYSCTGFIEEKSGKLHLKAPGTKHRIITDVVDEIMRIVLEKNGDIEFVQNGTLEANEHIALITRY